MPHPVEEGNGELGSGMGEGMGESPGMPGGLGKSCMGGEMGGGMGVGIGVATKGGLSGGLGGGMGSSKGGIENIMESSDFNIPNPASHWEGPTGFDPSSILGTAASAAAAESSVSTADPATQATMSADTSVESDITGIPASMANSSSAARTPYAAVAVITQPPDGPSRIITTPGLISEEELLATEGTALDKFAANKSIVNTHSHIKTVCPLTTRLGKCVEEVGVRTNNKETNEVVMRVTTRSMILASKKIEIKPKLPGPGIVLANELASQENRALPSRKCKKKENKKNVTKQQLVARTKRKPSVPQNLESATEVPGPGWIHKPVPDALQNRTHYFSPVRKIEFRRWQPAVEFEELRIKIGTVEVEAWEEFRRIKGGHVEVVNPGQYDAQPRKTKRSKEAREARQKPPPGPGWEPKLVPHTGQNREHWISPTRKIEFTRRRAASKFEDLRQKFGNDEKEAWEEYRKATKGKDTYVVSPQNYDAQPMEIKWSKESREARQKPPPGPGWERNPVPSSGQNRNNWISPGGIEFTRWGYANTFEELRQKFGNEEKAWEEYNKARKGKDMFVVGGASGGFKMKMAEAGASSGGGTVGGAKNAGGAAISKKKAAKRKREDEVCTTKKTRSSVYPGLRNFHVSDEAASKLDESVGECYVCRKVGLLVVCDYCSKEFHFKCHIPRLDEIPKGNWRCCECTAPLLTEKERCGECEDCLREDCGKCNSCQSIEENRGMSTCLHKQCKNMRYAAPERGPVVRSSQRQVQSRASKRQQRVQAKKQQNSQPRTLLALQQNIQKTGGATIPTSKREELDESVGECYICRKVGLLMVCDYCSKEFHLECHIPRLGAVPRGKWRCCECTAPLLTKKQPCGECEACLREDCGKCSLCRSTEENRGNSTCLRKQCKSMRYAAPEAKVQANSQPKAKPKSQQTSLSRNQLACNSRAHSKSQPKVQAENQRASQPINLVTCQQNKQKTGATRMSTQEKVKGGGEKRNVKSKTKKTTTKLSSATASVTITTATNSPSTQAVVSKKTESKKKAALKQKNTQKDTALKKKTTSKRTSEEVQGQDSTKAKRQKAIQTRSKSTCTKNQNESKPTNLIDCPFKSRSMSSIPAQNGLNNDYEVILKPEKKKNAKISFFEEYFGKQRTSTITGSLTVKPPEKITTKDGKKFTLASAKVKRENSGWNPFAKAHNIKLVYIQERCLSSKLEKICSFSLLKPEKVEARLAHLQSEADKVLYTERSKIEQIKDRGHEGCGFYPEGFLDGQNPDAMQVRIFGPNLGLAKGMLLKKRGITCIQLPSSMIKAQPSTICDDDWVAVVIKTLAPSEKNKQMGRFLGPNKDPAKSWINETKKPLSPMYQRMLRGFGVKLRDVDNYVRRSRKANKLCHANLRGCIDPTGKLPENKVFISGYIGRDLFGKVHKKVFISRSPSLEPGDAKLVSVVGNKPKGITSEEWDLLCSYSFGTIIFPQSKDNPPMPCVIADGDLDGDDYFVLWDEKIIHHLLHSDDKLTKKSRRVLHSLELPAGVKSSVDKSTKYAQVADPKWLSKAQDSMLDFVTKRDENTIVGMLYSLNKKASTKDDGEIDIYNKDAIAYARAYKDAMDIQKHGGKISLPLHLHENLPKNLQKYFVDL